MAIKSNVHCNQVMYWSSSSALTSLCTAATEQCVAQIVWSNSLQNRLELLSWPKDQTVVGLVKPSAAKCATVSVWRRAFIENSIPTQWTYWTLVKQSEEREEEWWPALVGSAGVMPEPEPGFSSLFGHHGRGKETEEDTEEARKRKGQ